MSIKLLLAPILQDGRIASSSGQRQVHRLLEQLEALDLLDGCLGGFGLLENDKSLALGLEVGLGDNIDDVAVLGEEGVQSFLESVRLDALLKVAHVDAVKGCAWSVARPIYRRGHACMCRSAMTHT